MYLSGVEIQDWRHLPAPAAQTPSRIAPLSRRPTQRSSHAVAVLANECTMELTLSADKCRNPDAIEFAHRLNDGFYRQLRRYLARQDFVCNFDEILAG
jgi:hypothetical protein